MSEYKVYASSIDGIHVIETRSSIDEAVVVAKEWLGSVYNEVSPICWISEFGDKVYIEEEKGEIKNDRRD